MRPKRRFATDIKGRIWMPDCVAVESLVALSKKKGLAVGRGFAPRVRNYWKRIGK